MPLFNLPFCLFGLHLCPLAHWLLCSLPLCIVAPLDISLLGTLPLCLFASFLHCEYTIYQWCEQYCFEYSIPNLQVGWIQSFVDYNFNHSFCNQKAHLQLSCSRPWCSRRRKRIWGAVSTKMLASPHHPSCFGLSSVSRRMGRLCTMGLSWEAAEILLTKWVFKSFAGSCQPHALRRKKTGATSVPAIVGHKFVLLTKHILRKLWLRLRHVYCNWPGLDSWRLKATSTHSWASSQSRKLY